MTTVNMGTTLEALVISMPLVGVQAFAATLACRENDVETEYEVETQRPTCIIPPACIIPPEWP